MEEIRETFSGDQKSYQLVGVRKEGNILQNHPGFLHNPPWHADSSWGLFTDTPGCLDNSPQPVRRQALDALFQGRFLDYVPTFLSWKCWQDASLLSSAIRLSCGPFYSWREPSVSVNIITLIKQVPAYNPCKQVSLLERAVPEPGFSGCVMNNIQTSHQRRLLPWLSARW